MKTKTFNRIGAVLAGSILAMTLLVPSLSYAQTGKVPATDPVPQAGKTDTSKSGTPATTQPATPAAPGTAAKPATPAAPGTATPAATPGQTATPLNNPLQNGTAFVPLTQFPQLQQIATGSSLPDFLNTLYKICIGAGAVLAVIMIMVAGAEIMTSRGSVSSNEKAKSRIRNAVLGLVLVLAPTIVFGIINPSILNLNFGSEFGRLQSSQIDPSAFAPTGSVAATTTAACTAQYPGGIFATVAGGTCASTAAYTIGTNCCPGLVQGGACCGRTTPDTSKTAAGTPGAAPTATPAPAGSSWMWRGPFENQDGGGRHTEQDGPFTTQQACQTSFTTFVNGHPNFNISGSGLTCDCTKPRSQFPGCAAG